MAAAAAASGVGADTHAHADALAHAAHTARTTLVAPTASAARDGGAGEGGGGGGGARPHPRPRTAAATGASRERTGACEGGPAGGGRQGGPGGQGENARGSSRRASGCASAAGAAAGAAGPPLLAPRELRLRLTPPEQDRGGPSVVGGGCGGSGGGPAGAALAALAADASAYVSAPAWGLSVALQGPRDAADIFHLPNTYPWVKRWLFSRPVVDREAFPDIALANSCAQSTTIYRAVPPPTAAAASTKERSRQLLDDTWQTGAGQGLGTAAANANATTASTSSSDTGDLGGSTGGGWGSAEVDITKADGCDPLPMLKATLACHWFMSPYQSMNGITVGLAFCQVVYDKIDRKMSVQSNEQPFGRFAMDENTGEVFITAFRDDDTLYVGWVRSVSTCERVRESFIFHAPAVDGDAPDLGQMIIRNSWFERRHCHICGLVDECGTLAEPCVGGPLRGRLSSGGDFAGFHFKSRRFRGNYFGIIVKTRLENGKILTDSVPIAIAVRKAPLFVDSIFKRYLWNSGTELPFHPSELGSSVLLLRSLGLDPRSSSKILMVGRSDFSRAVAAALYDPSTTASAALGGILFGIDHSVSAIPGAKTTMDSAANSLSWPGRRRMEIASDVDEGRVRRRRNADPIEPDPVLAARRRRNRIAAGLANERRKRLLETTKIELKENKKKIPYLESRLADLRVENTKLMQQLSTSRSAEPAHFLCLDDQAEVEESIYGATCGDSSMSSTMSVFPELL